MADHSADLRRMLEEVLAPLFATEGGEIYLVSAGKKEVRLHLAGTLSGAPAAKLVTKRVVEPAVHAVMPKATLNVSSGWLVPKGAQRMGG